MMKYLLMTLAFAVFSLLPMHSAKAQDKTAGVAESADEVLSAKAKESSADKKEVKLSEAKKENQDDDTLKQKYDYALKIHQIRPAAEQVDSAINTVAKALPPDQRETFKVQMHAALNYHAIERISIDAMIDTFTLKELKAMYEYYSKPEAISASEKMSDWAALVQPEITKMIDKALMRTKLGESPSQ